MKAVHETLAAAEEALLSAEAVRLAAFHAVEKAREAVSLKAAEVAADAVRAAELKPLEAWEAAASKNVERIRNRKNNDVM